jgi:hypothetical protein
MFSTHADRSASRLCDGLLCGIGCTSDALLQQVGR